MEIVNCELSKPKFTTECTAAYIETIRRFLTDEVATRLVRLRRTRGMFDASERFDEWDEETDLSMGASCKSLIYHVLCCTNLRRCR